MNTPSAPSRGFTLIELLTVIAIIGILAAILIPTVGAVRVKARESQASSNIRQTAVALLASAADYKGNIVPGKAEATAQGYTNWYNLLQNYLSRGNNTSQLDPIHVNPVAEAPLAPGIIQTQWGANPYVMPENADMISSIAGQGGRLTLANAATSRVALLTSTPVQQGNQWGGVGSAGQSLFLHFWGQQGKFTSPARWNDVVPASEPGYDVPGGIGFQLGGKSRNAALIAFMDGHVARVAKTEFTYGHLYRKN